MSASDFNSSDPVNVSGSSSDSPVVVPHDSSLSASSTNHQSSTGLSDQLQTVVSIGEAGPVVVVGAVLQRLVLVLDASGSMLINEKKVRDSVDIRTRQANDDGISVTMIIFSDHVILREFEAGKCPLLTRELYYPDGCTALFNAMGRAFTLAATMPTTAQILVCVESDGEDNIKGTTISELREQYAALKVSHPAFSAVMCSSGHNAGVVATDIGMQSDQVIRLDENRRDYGAMALEHAQRDFFSSEPGSRAAFSADDIMSSEGPSHHWQSHPSSDNGSSGVTLDGRFYPGVTAADLQEDHSDGYHGPSDYVPTEWK